MRAVFLHSGWRTGSTYFWNKFRRHERCLAFYEPFNEFLGSLSPSDVFLANAPQEPFHHPALEQPYFHEYLPILGPQGHPLFRDEFSCRNYFVTDQPLDDQRAYLESLLTLAERQQRVPVLGCVRTLGRVVWLQRTFDTVNIALIRSPLSQWMSGQHLAEQGYRFFDRMHFLVLSQAQGSAIAAAHARHHGIPRLDNLPAAGMHTALSDMVEASPASMRLEVFLSVYYLSYMAALPHADLVVDIDRLSAEPGYRATVRTRIADLTGIDLDFADARTPRYKIAAGSELAFSLDDVRGAIAASLDPLWGDGGGSVGEETGAARAVIEGKLADDCDFLSARP